MTPQQPLRPFLVVARLAALSFALLAVFGIALAWMAPPPQQDAAKSEVEHPAQDVDAPRATPRSAVKGYLDACRERDFEAAAEFLDLSRVEGSKGAGLARQLDVVLARELWIDPEVVSDDPEGDQDDGLDAGLERLGQIAISRGDVPILLARVSAEDGEREWRFAPQVVASIPDLYAEHGHGWVEKFLPQPFFEITVLQIELWQWIALLLAVVVASAGGMFAALGIVAVLRTFTRRTRSEWDDWLVEAAAGPLRFGLSLFAFWILTHLLALDSGAQSFLSMLCKALALVAVTWLILRGVDVLSRLAHLNLAKRNPGAADTLVPMGRRVTKVFILVLAGISLINNLGFNAAGLITGLGVGGLAFALAAQKTLENLFGGISVIVDKPVEVGQFCKVGDHMGTIEEIGLRSTRMRSLDRTVVTIPNSEFSTARIENFAVRDKIRLFTTLQFGYDTSPDQMRWLLIEIRKLLLSHPKVLRDPARVRFTALSAYSLDVEIFAFLETKDINEFHAIREDLYLRILDVVAQSGAYFAYPSQTLYLGRDGGRDPERTQAAEEAVRAWRDGRKLPMPDFPDPEVQAMAKSLAYPPEGSAVGDGKAG